MGNTCHKEGGLCATKNPAHGAVPAPEPHPIEYVFEMEQTRELAAMRETLVHRLGELCSARPTSEEAGWIEQLLGVSDKIRQVHARILRLEEMGTTRQNEDTNRQRSPPGSAPEGDLPRDSGAGGGPHSGAARRRGAIGPSELTTLSGVVLREMGDRAVDSRVPGAT